MIESTNSKKKKYGSIVQPDRTSPVNNKSLENYPQAYDDVRIMEEDDFIMKTAEELNLERKSNPS